MAMMMPQTSKTQTNVAGAQKTANDEVAPKPVTFNTASNSTNNVQEKTAPAVQPQTTETANNEAAVKPQQPVASQSVAQVSAKTISTSSANEQNASVEKPVVEKQTVAQPQTKASVQQNNFATTSQTVQTNDASSQLNNDLPINKGGYKLQLTGPKGNQTGTLSYNGSTLRTYKNINSVTSNSNQVILLSDNEETLNYITQPNNTDSISIKFTETKKGAISDAKRSNAQIVYVGNNKPNVKDTDPVDDFSYVKKDDTGYVLITAHPGSNQMTYTKGIHGTALGTAPDSIAQITSMSTSNPGADIIVKLQGGKQVDLRNNWLTQNTSSNTSKPASNTANNKDNNGSSQSKPATGSNANDSTNNKPNSTTKPAGTTGDTANGSTNKPADSSTSDTNKPSASSNANSNKPTNGSTSVNSNKPATGSSVSGNKPAANSNSNSNNSSASSSATNKNKPANGSTNSNTSADKPVSGSSTANAKPSTSSNGSSSSQAGSDSPSTSANKPANTSSSSAEQPIKVTVHYVGQDGKIVGTVVDTIQPGSTLDVSKNVPKGYEVSSAFKPQTGVQADNDQATLNVPVVPVGQNGKASQANDKSSANNTPNNDKKNAAQASNTQKSNDKQKATNGIQAQGKDNTQSLNINGNRNASEGAARQNVSANSNPAPTFNVAGNASQAASIAQATGNGQGGVQESASASIAQSNQASSVSTSNSGSSANALPETGMANEGITFAAAMLALAGFTMIKHEHEE